MGLAVYGLEKHTRHFWVVIFSVRGGNVQSKQDNTKISDEQKYKFSQVYEETLHRG